MRYIDLSMCLYTLCMAGREEDAERILAAVWDKRLLAGMPPGYWQWMNTTFGLKTPEGTEKPH
jgi:hypothetical protein